MLSESGHLVVCEDGDEHTQVIAANYAYALGAGLCLIPSASSSKADSILGNFYDLYETDSESPTSLLLRLKETLRSHAGELPISKGGAATFITEKLPWGFAYPEVPSTHLFGYPDLGISIINGMAAEQRGSRGIRVAALIDPGSVQAKEMGVAISSLTNRAVFVKGLRSKAATVHSASQLIELFPYDLLLISTHCGDASGWRWTYEFVDSEGLKRILVVDIAIGLEVVPGDEKLHVTEFIRFVSLDGIDWNDPEKDSKLYVGRAILDYLERGKTTNCSNHRREKRSPE